MTELAFLRAFLALETFLEESFVLYSIGQAAPRGRPPFRYTFPPTIKHAREWVKEGREYPSWNASSVRDRAHRYFRDGGPFTNALSGSQASLDETMTIRNFIAHKSTSAQNKFEALVRQKLLTLPSGITVGSFLGTIVPSSNPPQSFLEWYLGKAELVANQIVRSR